MKARKKKPAARKLTVVSLFSGCGGLDYGAQLAGCEVIYANDTSSDAISSLERLIPGVETFVGSCSRIIKVPKADIVCGGYPCQSFSMGGLRKPAADDRTHLYRSFINVLNRIQPKFFVVENVPGLISLNDGAHFKQQIRALKAAGEGYRVSWSKLSAADYGVPQRRKRVIIVGVRKDLDQEYIFPSPTHGPGLIPYLSHGRHISHLQDYSEGAYYERPQGEDSNFPWYYMSRNRRASADQPSFTIVANWRHTTLHPASPVMKMTWSNLSDGWKQRWDFSDQYDDALSEVGLRPLALPRRLTWRECSAIQTFPDNFEPHGKIEDKFKQIGNAVPPLLARAVFEGIVDGSSLIPVE